MLSNTRSSSDRTASGTGRTCRGSALISELKGCRPTPSGSGSPDRNHARSGATRCCPDLAATANSASPDLALGGQVPGLRAAPPAPSSAEHRVRTRGPSRPPGRDCRGDLPLSVPAGALIDQPLDAPVAQARSPPEGRRTRHPPWTYDRRWSRTGRTWRSIARSRTTPPSGSRWRRRRKCRSYLSAVRRLTGRSSIHFVTYAPSRTRPKFVSIHSPSAISAAFTSPVYRGNPRYRARSPIEDPDPSD
jgi:hypothetical protein